MGTMVSAEGGRYTGETNMEGKRQGRGEYIWPNNDRYMGDFADGVKNGNGILYFANGDKRVGVWKNDKLHGPATYYYSVGRYCIFYPFLISHFNMVCRIDEEVWEDDNKVSE